MTAEDTENIQGKKSRKKMFQEMFTCSCHDFEKAEATKYSSPVGFSLTVIVEAHSCDE